MVGGVLVERTVKDVLPALISNRDKMGRMDSDKSLSEIFDNFVHFKGKLIESLDKQLSDKGAEINGYMEKHNIQLRDQQVITLSNRDIVFVMTKIGTLLQGGGKKEDKSGAEDGKSGGGVLVSN